MNIQDDDDGDDDDNDDDDSDDGDSDDDNMYCVWQKQTGSLIINEYTLECQHNARVVLAVSSPIYKYLEQKYI